MKHSNISIFVPHVGCPNRCSFCNQNSISSTIKEPDGNFVRKELNLALKQFNGNFSNSQIAFFGGSFTAIPYKKMIELLEAANEYIGNGKFSSIRISTRPDCIDEKILDILKTYSVESIELGAQSMNDNTLLLNHRGHTSYDVVKASKLILSRGFELGLQMMPGLFGDTEADVFKTAEKIAILNPHTVRIYPTIVFKKTHLAELYEEGKYMPMSLEDAVRISSELLDFFESKKIKVIKLGLHASDTLALDYLAGPYHPAFRELCESRNFLKKIKKELYGLNKGRYIIYVNPKFISKAIGQKRCNIEILWKQGYLVNFIQDNDILLDSFRIEKGE